MKEFLDYWKGSTSEHDDTRLLYDAYQKTLAALGSSRLQTYRLLVPVNTGKAWHVGFDPDEIETVTALAAEIEQRKEALKTVCQDIETFMDIIQSPTLAAPNEELQRTVLKLKGLTIKAKNAEKLASRRNPEMSSLELQELPEVLAANAELAGAKEQLEPQITDLRARLAKARVILQKYEVHA
jgi:uncharacterized protein (DUF342 family)